MLCWSEEDKGFEGGEGSGLKLQTSWDTWGLPPSSSGRQLEQKELNLMSCLFNCIFRLLEHFSCNPIPETNRLFAAEPHLQWCHRAQGAQIQPQCFLPAVWMSHLNLTDSVVYWYKDLWKGFIKIAFGVSVPVMKVSVCVKTSSINQTHHGALLLELHVVWMSDSLLRDEHFLYFH